ncbi:PhoD-like phosphatase [Leptolyngbya boryana CZ1]|uniref:PhoD-like phosphatase n=1 Tax=Leptolyngbya boryana CZ1 TaxID=3060204 RepID=A0AA96XAP6_LEPBY|nr:PhoD-like phosphatase [Leptolyngbya boryana]WNZ48665.1 PhoD-like phosphatase [Leptolyngbya boryana CZ1]
MTYPELPLVLAGPILRHTAPEVVTVWVALQKACTVELRIYHTQAIDDCLFTGKRATVALGESLHVVAVTAQTTLQPDQLYAYDLCFKFEQGECSLQEGLTSDLFPDVNLSYFDHGKPTFLLPPTQIEDLKILHGSCRKPHGHGIDALPILDSLLETTAAEIRDRPHQLFLTGDQIYGDDVSARLLETATLLGDSLLGWQEKLPLKSTFMTASELKPQERGEIATRQAGFTGGLGDKRQKVENHLFSLGEYYATYLLSWSQIGWAILKPTEPHLERFVHTLWQVRRALANIPTYMIFDDHDVTDDWNLNQAWCLRVLGRSLGRRVVQNALLAYAVFQGWGNTPERFEVEQSGARLLDAAQTWSASQGRDRAALQEIAKLVGMPPQDPKTGLPKFIQDGDVNILDRHPDALTWNFIIRSQCHEILVLDTRTWRGYPLDHEQVSQKIAPPRLIAPAALVQQLSLLQDSKHLTTFLVAPTNLFGLQVIDWIHHWQLRKKKVFSTDVGDAWNVNTDALAQLLTHLFKLRDSIVVLSGDIHYSSTIRLSYQRADSAPGVLMQLTSSAMKNEELITRIIHTRLKHWLLPEPKRKWFGWDDPPHMIERSKPIDSPDWKCELEWIPRRAAEHTDLSLDRFPVRSRLFHFNLFKFWTWKWIQDGREIVGVNNLALVSFTRDDSSLEVIHTLYWFSSWRPLEIVKSRFARSTL